MLRDERQYNFDREAGFNSCPATDAACIASASSTYLDGLYPIQPADQAMAPDGSLLFRPPVRGGSGKDMLDTINLSLMGAPVSQRRDPTKPTWVIGNRCPDLDRHDHELRQLAHLSRSQRGIAEGAD